MTGSRNRPIRCMAAAMMLEVVKAVRKKFKEEGFIWNTHFSLPHCGGLFLLDHHTGQCPESCDITVYILRALGIPVGTDCYIASPYISGAAHLDYIKGYHRAVCPILDYPDGAGKRGG